LYVVIDTVMNLSIPVLVFTRESDIITRCCPLYMWCHPPT